MANEKLVNRENLKAFRQRLDNRYAKPDGNYPTLTAGLADNLKTELGTTQEYDYLSEEAILSSLDDDARASVTNIKGNSLVYNQLFNSQETTQTGGVTFTKVNDSKIVLSGVATSDLYYSLTNVQFPLINGHKILVIANNKTNCQLFINASSNIYLNQIYNLLDISLTESGKYIIIYVPNGTDFTNNKEVEILTFDLTKMFPTDTPTSIDDQRVQWLIQYAFANTSYNAGTLLSSKPTALISNGANLWKEDFELGSISTTDGQNITSSGTCRCADYVNVIPNTTYTLRYMYRVFFYDKNKNYLNYTSNADVSGVGKSFTTPMNCYFIRFNFVSEYGTTYQNNIILNLGSTMLSYRPYKAPISYPLSLPVLRGVGSVQDDISKVRIGIVDLGTLIWGYNSTTKRFETVDLQTVLKEISSSSIVANLLCSIYKTVSGQTQYDDLTLDMTISQGTTSSPLVRVRNLAYTDPATFKSAMSGVLLYYELKTPTDQPTITLPENIEFEKGGSLEVVYDSANPTPADFDVFYQLDLKGFVEEIGTRTDINWDADEIVSHTELEAETADTVDRLENGEVIVGNSQLADNLDTNLINVDNQAYNFRTSGGSLEIAETCREKAIVGGSLGFNQVSPIKSSTLFGGLTVTTTNDGWTVYNGTITSAPTGDRDYGTTYGANGHALLAITEMKGSSTSQDGNLPKLTDGYNSASIYCTLIIGYRAVIIKPSGNTIPVYYLGAVGDTLTNLAIRVQYIDLTAIFGSTIADYIYNLEIATAGAGVAWFKRYFNKPYYSYKAVGGFTNVITRGKKVVGFNQWDEQWEVGGIDYQTGQNSPANTLIRSKNYIPCIPNTTYYFKFNSDNTNRVFFYDKNKNYLGYEQFPTATRTTPANCYYIRFRMGSAYGTTYNHDICINFHYDGERDGEYEPYEEHIYENDPVELIGIPQIDAQGNLYFEGNKYNYDGSIDEEYGIVDLGTLNWEKSNNCFYTTVTDKLASSTDLQISNGYTELSDRYSSLGLWESSYDKVICVDYGVTSKIVLVKDTAYDNKTTFKTAMSGVYLIYQKATPTTSQATPFQEQQQVFNWGTEERLPPLNDTRPCEVPVGHETDYLTDLKSKLEILPNLPSADGTYVCKVESGVGEYIPLATWLLNNGYPTGDTLATKEALGGTLRQLLCVKESLDFDNTNYVDLDDLTATYYNGVFSIGIPNKKLATNKILCTKYKTNQAGYTSSYPNDDKCVWSSLDNQNLIYVKDTAYTDATAFKTVIKGVLLAYEKASS